jgi:predicted transcriptional regulator
MQAKQVVRELLDRLPDDCSFDDVLYHLYVIRAVERGLADVAEGRTVPHEKVVEELRKKWQLGDGA